VGGDFEQFYRDVFTRLAQALFLLTRDPAEAEELAQEALARTFERWDRVGSMESPVGYAFRTALNLQRKGVRRAALRARASRQSRRPREEERDPAAVVETRNEVLDALRALSQEQREAVVLVEWLGLTTEEAAASLGIEPVSVRARVHRARIALRRRLERDDE
jgi:RNA polymerase sigma factor (sigma-70 family)